MTAVPNGLNTMGNDRSRGAASSTIQTEKADSRVMESVLLIDFTVVRQSVTFKRRQKEMPSRLVLVPEYSIVINDFTENIYGTEYTV